MTVFLLQYKYIKYIKSTKAALNCVIDMLNNIKLIPLL